MRLNQRSISYWIISTIVFTITVMLGISTFINYAITQKNEWEQLQDQVDMQVSQLSTTIALPLWNLDIDQVKLIIDNIMLDETIYSIQILNYTHFTEEYNWSRNEQWVVTNDPTQQDLKDSLFAEKTIVHNDREIGLLKVVVSTHLIREELLKNLWLNLVTMLLTDLVIVFVLYFFLFRIVIRPIQVIENFSITHSENSGEAEILEDNNFSHELFILANSISSMVKKLTNQLAKIKDSERKIRGILDTSSVFIGLMTVDGDIIETNMTSLAFIGMTLDSLVGKKFYNAPWFNGNNEVRERVQKMVENASAGKLEYGILPIMDQYGKQYMFELTIKPIKDDSGKTIYLFPEGHDITELKKIEQKLVMVNSDLEEKVRRRTSDLVDLTDSLQKEIVERIAIEKELQVSKDEADFANKAKSVFLANMSHEIRTPMNAVLGFAQLLSKESCLSAEAHKKVEIILRSGNHLMEIINEILEMSRIESGRLEVRKESIDFYSLLDDISNLFHLQAIDKGLELKVNIDEDVPRYIIIDAVKLRQILTNIIGNAFKFTPKGSIEVFAKRGEQDIIQVEVHDSGIGMTDEEQQKIFEPFFRTSTGEKVASGTGLGLSISREYAKLLNGDLRVISQLGQGSCFILSFHGVATVLLPQTATHRIHYQHISKNQSEVRILVVDDAFTNRELLRQLLAPLGFVIDEAANGYDAIDKVEAFKPHIVIMDLIMPEFNGIETTHFLRQKYTQQELTIIGLTASVFEEKRREFMNAGLNAFLTKPLNEQELISILIKENNLEFDIDEQNENTKEGNKDSNQSSTDAERVIKELTIEKMAPDWIENFKQAMAQGSISRLKKLAESIETLDHDLAKYILDATATYSIESLKRFIV